MENMKTVKSYNTSQTVTIRCEVSRSKAGSLGCESLLRINHSLYMLGAYIVVGLTYLFQHPSNLND